MTPLDRIREWYEDLPSEIQIELCVLTALLHYDKELKKLSLDDEASKNYLAFMSSEGLDGYEILTRTLFMMNLFDFSLYGRDTEEGWDKALDRNLDIKNAIASKGNSTDFMNNVFADWQKRKYQWIGISNTWKATKEKYLNGEELNRYLLSALTSQSRKSE